MSALPEFPAANDPDAPETQEWLDALEAVLEREGPERAHYLLEKLVDKARRSEAYIPFSLNTAYLNTIPAHMEELLHVRRDRVEVGRIEREGNVGLRTACLVDELLQQVMGALRTLAFENGLERIEPFLRFRRVGVVGGGEFRQRGHDVSLSARRYGRECETCGDSLAAYPAGPTGSIAPCPIT